MSINQLGTVGELEIVEEWRIEVMVPQENARAAVTALIQAHSYEEPAWELVRLTSLDQLP